MVASMAQDDPEGWHYLELTESHRDGDPDVFLLSNLQGVGNLEVNAFQRESDRRRAEVAARGVRPGRGRGDVEGTAGRRRATPAGSACRSRTGSAGTWSTRPRSAPQRVIELIGDAALRAEMGRAAKERVRERFLTPRELEDYLRMLAAL